MSKAVSYYDWKLSFKRKVEYTGETLNDNDSVNSLGIKEESFKDFMKKWKEKNF
ncbi:MAG: hypothetical protein ACFFEN_06595 [Candidatus Thorarchaeota archaeon]